ncbi:MAG: UDP-N-acetylmuramoyl-L-alanyl-D-glutamate--2,6-diaminopimelate ligase [Candidatus Levybacteria bacterium]|nr:UDP-N-acetylmuramoyl-L-alanyl-D-glutamate--2,6-diaminopimelate ligase [Candidatus Levybacteria bacterium]
MIRKLKNTAHAWQSNLASFFYGSPAKKIFTIGVTGTDGKTTTASLIFHILKTSGKKAAMITSVGAQIRDEVFDTGFHTTTPSSFSIQRYVKKAIDRGCEFLVLEVTSHALDQNRVHGMDFKIGVITNVSHEHLDYHGSYENYLKAKSKLLRRAQIPILNEDDESFRSLESILSDRNILTYSQNDKNSFKLPKLTRFNISNFLAAIAVAKVIGIDKKVIEKAITTFKMPEGRQEVVYDKQFRVIIDFAHTPNAFGNLLPEVKKATRGRLIHVFGAAGQRDKSKRPFMGEISAEYADVIILTAEDPRSEKIEDINAQIKLGIKNFKGELLEFNHRQEAINTAVRIAQKGDVVIATGKGHEKSMNLGRGEVPWSDHEAVKQAVKLVNSE